MSCITEIITLHEIKGRIRLKVPQIRGSEKNSTELKKTLQTLPGIYSLRACPHLGTVVIYYNQKVLSKDKLIETIHHCPFPESEEKKPDILPRVHIKSRGTTHRKALFSSNHLILFDLLKHGVMAGGGGGYITLALIGIAMWRYLHGQDRKRKMEGQVYGQRTPAA